MGQALLCGEGEWLSLQRVIPWEEHWVGSNPQQWFVHVPTQWRDKAPERGVEKGLVGLWSWRMCVWGAPTERVGSWPLNWGDTVPHPTQIPQGTRT